MSNSRKKYDEEFKKRAVRMSYSSERPDTAVAESLGVTCNMIYRWRKKYTPDGDKHSWPSSRASSANFAEGLRSWKRKTTY